MHGMSPLPHELYRAAAVRELDCAAIEGHGIPGYTLMCRAGEAVLRLVRECCRRPRRVVVLCGGGNNGGDGYVVARLAREAGLDSTAIALSDPAKLSGAAAQALSDYRAAGGVVAGYEETGLPAADCYVDAMLGTGLDREVAGAYREAVQALNASGAPVIAVDIPSGLHADTGMPLGVAVRARATATFIGVKQGLLTGEAPDYTGRIAFDDLAVPAGVYDAVAPTARRTSADLVGQWLGPRPRCAHKGRYGHVLVVGGNYGMPGAVRLAAAAAARVGSGLVSVATRPEHAFALPLGRPEAMARGIDSADELDALLQRATVVALGPGLGRDAWAEGLFERVLASELPVVADADALNLSAARARERGNWVLTPHPGEAARLLATDVPAVQRDRFAAVAALVERYAAVAVLKGAGSLVAGPEDIPAVCSAGNPGMAAGGMGDLLTGIIAGLIAQDLPLRAAAEVGVWLHAAAADRAAADGGERGLLATDCLAPLRSLANP